MTWTTSDTVRTSRANHEYDVPMRSLAFSHLLKLHHHDVRVAHLEGAVLYSLGDKVPPRCLWCSSSLDNGIGIDDKGTSGKERVDVLRRLVDITFNIHGETGRLWDGETEIKGNNAGEASQADDETPYKVYVAGISGVVMVDGIFECGQNNGRNNRGRQLTWR